MKRNRNVIDGDLYLSGTLRAAGVNSADMARVVTKVAATDESMRQVEGSLTTVVTGTDSYINNLPPTNNVTGLALDSESNADGSINVNIAWDYEQGTIPADGFLVIYTSDDTDPVPLELVGSQNKYVPCQPGTGTQAYHALLPGLPARFGGVGAVARRYRFGVIAVGNRAGGMIPCETGGGSTHIIETPSGYEDQTAPTDDSWINKTFASAISLGEGSSTVNIEGRTIVFRDQSTGAFLSQIVYDAATDTLQIGGAISGGLGLLGKLAAQVAYRGSWIMGSWGTPTAKVSGTQTSFPELSLLSDGRTRCVYRRAPDAYLMEIMIAANGTWGTPVERISYDAYSATLSLLSDGRTRCVYMRNSNDYLMEVLIATDGTWGTPVERISSSDSATLSLLSDGRTRCVYRRRSDSYLMEVFIEADGTWGTPAVKVSSGCHPNKLELLPDGRTRLVYTRSGDGYLMEIMIAANGTWGTPVVRVSYYTSNADLSLLPDGRTRCVYQRSSDLYGMEVIIATDGTWGTPAVRISSASFGHSTVVLPDGRTRCAYVRGSDEYIMEMLTTDAYSTVPIKDEYTPVGTGIIESGQTTDGYYVKFGDGTMMQYTDGDLTMSGTGANATRDVQWTFPVEWPLGAQSYAISWYFMENTSGVGYYNSGQSNLSATSAWLYGYATGTGTSYCRAMAIGRWK